MPTRIFSPANVAVITGAASGIGLAAARRCAEQGMRVCLIDVAADELAAAEAALADLAPGAADDVMAALVNVSDRDGMVQLKEQVYARFGRVNFLMNNAATRAHGDALQGEAQWQEALAVNLMGVVHGVHAFVPAMIEQGDRCRVVNTGSKQGITNPPGNLAYNVAKSGVKTFTEGLQHDLRNRPDCHVSAHLLVPGWTTTGKRAHQPGAWLPEQVIDLMFARLADNDFYIICPDDEVTPALDNARILWGAGDITENRPPLSRWDAAWKQEFERWLGQNPPPVE